MAMGTRRECQEELWIPTCTLARPASHPFYQRLNQLLAEHDFDRFAEGQCRRFYATVMGRPGLAPGVYFRLLLVGYFEGIDSERGIAWRAGDSLSIREFVGIPLNQGAPDHTTISRTRRLIDLETHRQVFAWVLGLLADAGLADERRFEDGFTRYEYKSPNSHHDHLICTKCGAIIEFENERIEALQQDVARKNRFLVQSHKLELYGLCAACQGKKNQKSEGEK